MRALVKFKPVKPICVETYSEYPRLGTVIVRDHRKIIATGIIKSVEKDAATAISTD